MTSTTQLTPLRYDSPTVTLEVMARQAAVSQWSDKPVVQVLRYQLYIRASEETDQPLEIRGDRDSFLPLIDAVQTYIQSQLVGAPMERGDRGDDQPHLVPDGFTRHTLHLGSLRTTTGAATASLGALQLADLGDVVDQLDTQVRPLPVSLAAVPQRRPWRQWSTIAAGMVAAVGITTALWPTYQSQLGSNTAVQAPATDLEIAPAAPQETAPPNPAASSSNADNADEDNEADAIEDAEPAAPKTTPDAPVVAQQPAGATGSAPKTTTGSPSASPSQNQPPPPPDSTSTDEPPLLPAPSISEPEPVTSPPSPPPAARAPESVTAREVPPEEPTESFADAVPSTSEADQFPGGVDGLTDSSEPEALAASEAGSAAVSPGPSGEINPALSSLDILLATVRDRWAPPESLKQTLTYTLIFDAAGTLVEVIPQDALAEQYRDLTGLPLLSAPESSTDNSTTIELLFQPDGTVNMVDVTPN